jgi:phosphatidylglycerol:prolipoprotein diacylglycerol transferase
MDIIVVSLILGQILGRWGNFMNSEAYGPETTQLFLKSLHIPTFIINGMYINGTYYHPTFLYESLWNLIGLIIMLIIRHNKHNRLGFLSSFYLIWYGIGRFFIESLRTDSLMFFNLKIAQMISIIMIIIGIILFVYSKRKDQKYE